MAKKTELLEIRKIVTVGNGKGITLPKDWLEKNKAKVGDRVRIIECRPFSKEKRFHLLEVVAGER